MKIEINFKYQYGNSWPKLVFDSSHLDIKCHETSALEHQKNITYTFTSTQPYIKFRNYNKSEYDTVLDTDNKIIRDQVLTIDEIFVDNILIDKFLIKDYVEFVPEYSQGYLEYCQQNNMVPELTLREYTLFFNGNWSFSFKEPFWDWYFVLKQAIHNSSVEENLKKLYLGTTVNDHQDLFNKLKQLVNDA